MSDPTTVQAIEAESQLSKDTIEATIKSAEALVRGGLAGILYGTGAMEFAETKTALVPAGYVLEPADGNNDHLTGDGTYKAVCRTGEVLKNVSVTGAASAADFGKLVYASDGSTLTLTKPTAGLPCGYVKKWSSSTYCDVALFTLAEAIMWSFIPRKETICIGTILLNALQGTSAMDVIKHTIRKHCTIDSFYAYPVGYDNAAIAGSQVLNLEIGTTNLTGGALTLAYTSFDAEGDMGTAIAATAITAGNEAAEGDVVTVELAASGTGFTADTVAAVALFIDITILPGA